MIIINCIIERETCPGTHPFAYLDGTYCCKYGVEKVDVAVGERCDGGTISLNSVCCKDNEHTPCPIGLCKNLEGNLF